MSYKNINLSSLTLKHHPTYYFLDADDYTIADLEMGIPQIFESKLEAIESWGEDEGLLTGEQEVSDRFDEEMVGSLDAETFLRVRHDKPWISEEFSLFMDRLCADGELHSEQVSNYCYVNSFDELDFRT